MAVLANSDTRLGLAETILGDLRGGGNPSSTEPCALESRISFPSHPAPPMVPSPIWCTLGVEVVVDAIFALELC